MIKYLKNENFEDLVKDGVTLVDFYADWCGPCKMMGEILEKTNFNILKINTDEHNELALKFGVMSIPTLFLFKDGVLVDKLIGLQSLEEINNFMKKAE